jgi:hypothetical protein
MGQKAAKNKRSQDNALDLRLKRGFTIKEQMVASHNRRNDLIEEQSNMAILSMVAPEGDEIAAEILKLKKLESLNRIKQRMASNPF